MEAGSWLGVIARWLGKQMYGGTILGAAARIVDDRGCSMAPSLALWHASLIAELLPPPLLPWRLPTIALVVSSPPPFFEVVAAVHHGHRIRQPWRVETTLDPKEDCEKCRGDDENPVTGAFAVTKQSI